VLFLGIGAASGKTPRNGLSDQKNLDRILSGFDVILMGAGVIAMFGQLSVGRWKSRQIKRKRHKDNLFGFFIFSL